MHSPSEMDSRSFSRAFERTARAQLAVLTFATKAKGLGLGLYIVRMIVERSGGKIWAENRAGGGAIFRISLPLAEEPAA